MYLIDTNILSYLIRGQKEVEKSFVKNSESIALCSIVHAECVFGAKKVGDQDLLEVYGQIFATYPVLGFDLEASEVFTSLKAELSGSGKIVADFDLMLAAICLAHNSTLVTKNIKHFANIPNLDLEDWTN